MDIASTDRWLDMGLAFKGPDATTHAFAGGVFDRLERAFAHDREPSSVTTLDLQPGQVEFIQWFAEQLAAVRLSQPRREVLAVLTGERRTGCIFASLAAVLAGVVDRPAPNIGILVTSNFRQREELEQQVLRLLPAGWYAHQKAPINTFRFANGGILRLLSADDEAESDALRQGRIDWLLLDDVQRLPRWLVATAILGVAGAGGLAIATSRLPQPEQEGWTEELVQAIDRNDVDGAAVHFNLNARANSGTRGRVGRLVEIIAGNP